ncbi:cupin domain-containing protein [uncultured Ramlibacter sp.]|uniref:cupin domain-containing protein n=1 Tax=uncultured Ramlibacter sp. TaxID=260755 RepID=UPI002625E58A|nr:cupin domain-containing protein [uncultured Ramlibacter sp.]
MSFPPIHRVVTGHDANGKAVFVSNGPLTAVHSVESVPGMIFHEVWEVWGTPPVVGNTEDPTLVPLKHTARKNGVLLRFFDFPPDESYLSDDKVPARMKHLFDEVRNPEGLTTKPDSPHPMMHRSEAIDYGIVIEGEIILLLDDSEVHLKPGSVVVQRGTNHAWANRSGKPCRMLYVQIDGQYDPAIAALLAPK